VPSGDGGQEASFAAANALRPPGRSMQLFLTGLLLGFGGLWPLRQLVVGAFARKESKS
jgi:hypothetical protein